MSTPSKHIPQSFRAYNLVKPGGGFGSDNLKIVEVFSPPIPQSGQVLIRIHAVALNYRDQLVSKNSFGSPTIPANLVPCSDSAGEIIALGPNVGSWAVGQRVCANFTLDRVDGDPTPETYRTSMGAHYTPGVLAEYRVFPAHSLVEIPDHLSWEEASTLPCAALTAYNALLGQMPKPIGSGDTVLVLGTGGVSTFALQIASATGAIVIATSSSDDKLQVAKKLGAKHLINYKKTPDWEEEVLKITNGRGVDHVVEVGGFGTLERSLKSIRMGGSVAIVGVIAQVCVLHSPGLHDFNCFKECWISIFQCAFHCLQSRNSAWNANRISHAVQSTYSVLLQASDSTCYR
jgi:NADPH:quinone reductase-like Zn-dependent oxidoreductase